MLLRPVPTVRRGKAPGKKRARICKDHDSIIFMRRRPRFIREEAIAATVLRERGAISLGSSPEEKKQKERKIFYSPFSLVNN